MYGHNNGVVCVAISHCGSWLASACKARDRETAAILLWNTIKYVFFIFLMYFDIGWKSAKIVLQFHILSLTIIMVFTVIIVIRRTYSKSVIILLSLL